MTEGQRKARHVQRIFAVYAVICLIGAWWKPETTRWMAGVAILLFAMSGIIDAMRALMKGQPS